ncbi:hypothetical protein [Corynebacterium cystitidis]|uniref:hypothetical protein n=1 Tax=Corynebacterium cystitidis TaxID=35757 RepID=UPI00211F222A|nr:hypothetical protein [Corynebacterium cystitidis]
MEQTQKTQSKSPTVRDEEPTDWWQSRLGGFAATFSFFTLVCLISVLNGFPLLDLMWFRVSEDASRLQPAHFPAIFTLAVITVGVGLLAHWCIPARHLPSARTTVVLLGTLLAVEFLRWQIGYCDMLGQKKSAVLGHFLWVTSFFVILVWQLKILPRQAQGATREKIRWHNNRVEKFRKRSEKYKRAIVTYVSAILAALILNFGPVLQISLEAMVPQPQLVGLNLTFPLLMAVLSACWFFLRVGKRKHQRVLIDASHEFWMLVFVILVSSLLTGLGWFLPSQTSVLGVFLSQVWLLFSVVVTAVFTTSIDRADEQSVRYQQESDGVVSYLANDQRFFEVDLVKGLMSCSSRPVEMKVNTKIFLKVLDGDLDNASLSLKLKSDSEGKVRLVRAVYSQRDGSYLVYGSTDRWPAALCRVRYLIGYIKWPKVASKAPINFGRHLSGTGRAPVVISPSDVPVTGWKEIEAGVDHTCAESA